MPIQFQELVLASRNPHKLEELQAYLAPYQISISLPPADLPDIEETGTTFAANALLKADTTAQATGLPALADDSGLCVWALDGSPGIYSARWAGPDQDYPHAFQRIEDGLQQAGPQADRSASFICVLALCFPDRQPSRTFEGRIDGTIITPPRGPLHFGYDPIFVPESYRQTFAEMPAIEKQKISHRTRALQQFIAALEKGL